MVESNDWTKGLGHEPLHEGKNHGHHIWALSFDPTGDALKATGETQLNEDLWQIGSSARDMQDILISVGCLKRLTQLRHHLA